MDHQNVGVSQGARSVNNSAGTGTQRPSNWGSINLGAKLLLLIVLNEGNSTEAIAG
ncbi:hypothetical protein NG796_22285 [Laspinema sp. A4]|uniref:hypothetical protein n=1 Tax=Laspinema sp. D2d TaxID=2953686 RepID=UPI0021BB6214|nr:hypothetical protein [Laspinema sp. D2d]MCT7986010.1 hypothetical protein [Laspinema sp. D2d]